MAQLGQEKLGNEETGNHDFCTLDENAPHFGGCGARNRRTKTTTIIDTGPILVLHLLRFTWDQAQTQAIKLHTKICFETVLPPLSQESSAYDLRAVIEHTGNHPTSANSGHYTAYVSARDGMWYLCDDANDPRRCNIEQVLAAQAYMLFYERR